MSFCDELLTLTSSRRHGPAVVYGDQAFTAEELGSRAEELAEVLSSLGVSAGHRVGLMLGNSPLFAVGMMAVMRLRASSVLLSTRFKELEVADAILRTGVAVLLTTTDATSCLARLESTLVCTRPLGSDFCRDLAIWRTGVVAADATPEEMTLQFTSGVSGRSKIVPRTVANLADELESFAARLELGPRDVVLCPAPLFHAYGLVNGFLLPFYVGARAILVDWFLPSDILDAARRHRPSVLVGVPAMYKSLAEVQRSRPADLSGLRITFSAGAPLTPVVLDAFCSRFGRPIHQQYGSTETGVIAVNLLEDGGETDPFSVGRPVPGREVEIVNDQVEPVEAGVEGEVVVRSRANALGYLDEPLESRQRFRRGGYLTGDLGRIDASGNLVLTGRRTSFINVAGMKVDPREVENVLTDFNAVAECAVLGMPDVANGGELVKAVVVARRKTSEQEVRVYCSQRLARYKVPRRVSFVEGLPRSAAGKVLTKYLIDI